MRELTQDELDIVAGGGDICCCPAPPPMIPTTGNPGNLKPVGKAGEAPNGNAFFVFGGTFIPVLNGQKGMSSG